MSPPRQRTMPLAEQVLERDANPDPDESFLDPPVRLFLPTGCTLLNLAFTDDKDKGWAGGRIEILNGDSDTAKTVGILTSMAEACKLPDFNDYQLILADAEAGLSINLRKMFGDKLTDRIKILSMLNDDKEDQPPQTVQELNYQLKKLFKEGKPFIYGLDSLDALPSEEELEKSNKQFNAWLKNKDTTGTMAMSKQKYLSQMFREIKGEIQKTESFLIIIGQTRDNVNSQYENKTSSGGRAKKFFCTHEIWLSDCYRKQMPHDDVRNGRQIGKWIEAEVKKNRITGKKRTAPFWVYDHYGIHDIRTCIDFLTMEGHWAKLGGWIAAKEFLGPEGKLQIHALMNHIAKNKQYEKLKDLVAWKWAEIEESLQPEWEPRYE